MLRRGLILPHTMPKMCEGNPIVEFLDNVKFQDYNDEVLVINNIPAIQAVYVKSKFQDDEDTYIHFYGYINSKDIDIYSVILKGKIIFKVDLITTVGSTNGMHNSLINIAKAYKDNEYEHIVLVTEMVSLLKLLN